MAIKIIECRVIEQTWYETEFSKTGWDSGGWYFADNEKPIGNSWTVVQHLRLDKFGNPYLGVAQREVII